MSHTPHKVWGHVRDTPFSSNLNSAPYWQSVTLFTLFTVGWERRSHCLISFSAPCLCGEEDVNGWWRNDGSGGVCGRQYLKVWRNEYRVMNVEKMEPDGWVAWCIKQQTWPRCQHLTILTLSLIWTCYRLGPVLIMIVSVVLPFLGMYCPGVISVLCYFNTMCWQVWWHLQ